MAELQINYLAVVGAAAATILIGALWYSPIMFSRPWLEAHGFTLERMREMGGRSLMVSVGAYLVMAFVFSVLLSYTGMTTISQGAMLGGLLWLGWLATLGLTSHTVLQKPFSIYMIDSGFQLVYSVVMGVILTAWR